MALVLTHAPQHLSSLMLQFSPSTKQESKPTPVAACGRLCWVVFLPYLTRCGRTSGTMPRSSAVAVVVSVTAVEEPVVIRLATTVSAIKDNAAIFMVDGINRNGKEGRKEGRNDFSIVCNNC